MSDLADAATGAGATVIADCPTLALVKVYDGTSYGYISEIGDLAAIMDQDTAEQWVLKLSDAADPATVLHWLWDVAGVDE